MLLLAACSRSNEVRLDDDNFATAIAIRQSSQTVGLIKDTKRLRKLITFRSINGEEQLRCAIYIFRVSGENGKGIAGVARAAGQAGFGFALSDSVGAIYRAPEVQKFCKVKIK